MIEDSGSALTSVLALKTGENGPDGDNNLVTFYDGTDAALGSIEGNGGGGVNYTSEAADFAEYLPRLDPAEDVEAGDVVGLVDGAVTKRTDEADQAFVVSGQPVVTGNAPGVTAEDRADHETVALVGQVAATVVGAVETGDVVVPSGQHDGTGRAIDPAAWTPGSGPIVGRALEGSDETAPTAVTVAVGLETGEALAPAVDDHDERLGRLERSKEDLRAELDRKDEVIEDLTTAVEALRAETERLRAENDALADRLGRLEERIETLEGGAARVASADD